MQPRNHEDTKNANHFFTVLFVFFVSFVAAPQAQQSQPIFRSGSLLIVETVTVKDTDGKPIEGLTAKDFTITEDGEPQTISFVEFQRLPGAGATVPQAEPAAPLRSPL